MSNEKPKIAEKKTRKKKVKEPTPKTRLDILKGWQDRKKEQELKANRRLNAYVDRITKRYPKDFIDKIREGLEDSEKFNKTMEELEEEENTETEREFLEKLSRNVKPED